MSRKGLLIPRKIYNDISNILFDAGLIPIIPELKWTTDKTVYGYLCIKPCKSKTGITKNEYSIYINRQYCPEVIADFNNYYKWSINNFRELLSTCCHELAHLIFGEHDINHQMTTEKFTKIIYDKFNFTNDKAIMQYIKDCKKDY